MKKKLLPLSALLLLLPSVAGATTYWVGPGLAHETFAALIADVVEQDGDIIYLQRGVTYTETLNIYANLDIRPFGTGAMPIIDATGLDWGAIIWNGKTCKITGIEAKGANGGLLAVQSGTLGVWQADGVYLHDNVANPCVTFSGSGAFLKNSLLQACANSGVYGKNASNSLTENTSILDTVTNDAWVMHDGVGDNNIVRRCVLRGAPENAVDNLVGFTNTIIEDSDLSETGLAPIGSSGPGLIVRRNYVHDCARGLRTDSLSYFYSNYLYNLSDETIGIIGDSGGIYFDGSSDGSEFINNTVVEGTQVNGRPIVTGATGVASLVIKNNIFDQNKNTTLMQFIDASPSGMDIDYNWYNTGYSRLVQAGATIYSSLAAWQATGQDLHSGSDELHLSATGKPSANTPYAVKRGGDLWDGGPSIAGRWGYMGAYPHYPPTLFPIRQLSIPGGPGRIGGGTVYDAPVELVTFGGESATFGGEAATW